MKHYCVLPIFAFINSCVSTQAEDPVRKKAAFDLGCARDKLSVATLSEDNVSGAISYGVSGCDKKASYLCQRKIVGNAVCIKESETSVN